jgi:hypothetical protein
MSVSGWQMQSIVARLGIIELTIVFCFLLESAYEIRPGEWPSAPPAVILCVLLPADRRWLLARADNAALLLQSAMLRQSLRARRPSTRIGNRGMERDSQENVMRVQHAQERQVCDHCGGRFGLVTHCWWGNKFCKRACRDNHIREVALDRDAIGRGLWFPPLPSRALAGRPSVLRVR